MHGQKFKIKDKIVLDEYFKSDSFKHILHKYEELCKNNVSSFLDSEELADIAEYYHIIGKDEEAKAAAIYAINIFPGAIAPLCFMARCAMFIDKNIDKAKSIAEEILDKTDLDYYYLNAEIMIVQMKTEEANIYLLERFSYVAIEEQQNYVFDVASLFCDYALVEFAQKWLSLYEDVESPEYKELKVRILLWNGGGTESEEILNSLIDTNPYSTTYWNELAKYYFLNEKYEKSITASEYTLAIDPKDEDALSNKANAFYSIGNYKEAINYYKRLQKITIGGLRKSLNISIANAYLSENNIEEAFKYFTKAIDYSEKKEEIYIKMAISLMGNGYIREAYQIFSDYMEDMSEDWNIGYACYARCCFELGLMEKYKKILEIAIKKNLIETEEVLADLYPEGSKPEEYPQLSPKERNVGTNSNFNNSTFPF